MNVFCRFILPAYMPSRFYYRAAGTAGDKSQKKNKKTELSNKFQASVFLFYVTMYRAVGLKSRLAAKSFISHR